MFNSKRELVDDITTTANSGLTITWTTHEPTATTGMTIADGSSPSVAESGQFMQNITTIVNQLVVDVATIKAAINA